MSEDSKLIAEQREKLNASVEINPNWKFEESFPSISAYVTAYNCIKNNYPIFDAIKSFSWVDELVVLDGGSTDETVDELNKLKEDLPNLQVYEVPIDWDCPGKDGQQKAMARAMCMNEVLIQFDADEICLGEIQKWKRLAKDLFSDILELPVIEPLGKIDSVRLNKEHNPVKWRMYKNKPEITHGIPLQDKLEKDGKVFSKGYSDGCFPINVSTEHRYPSRLSQEASKVKKAYNLIFEKEDSWSARKDYISLWEEILETKRPAVLHLGHVNLENKIKLFLNEWRNWWADLYGKDPTDISMYFENKKLEDITEEDIVKRAKEISKETPTITVSALSEFESLTDENENEGHSV